MLKLLYAPTSPYVRKVMACAHLAGLAGRIQWLESAAHPVRRDDRIVAHNPLAKVPTLILEDGTALYDSRVICEYLADLGASADLFPAAGARRWQALTRQALGDGLLDAALLARYEHTARPAEFQWPAWREAQLAKVSACLDAIEQCASMLATRAPTIGEVTLGCALGYLDFRFPELDWRARHTAAARWQEAFSALPAMQATLPHDI
nr:glutathione S-transferase [Achromobacter ruhlandii]